MMTNEEVLDFIRKRIAQMMKPDEVHHSISPSLNCLLLLLQICECLLDHCLAPDCRMGGVGCDNMTIILVCFLHGGTYANLAEHCSVARLSKDCPDGAGKNGEDPSLDLSQVLTENNCSMNQTHHRDYHNSQPQQLSCTF